MASTCYQRITSLNMTPARHTEPEDDSAEMEHLGFDCQFLRRFRRLVATALSNPAAVLVMVVLLVLSVLYEVIVFQVGLVTSQYYVVLGERDWWGFVRHTVFCLALIVSVSIVKSAKKYTSCTVTIQWRQLITKRLQELYLSRKVHYKINVVEGLIDNPDQRMTQDVDRLCQKLASIVPTLLVSPFTIAYYSYQSYKVAGVSGPLSVFCYFLLSTLVNKFLISPVVPRVYELEKQEGRFRYKHAQLRAHSESVAFLDGEFAELESTEDHLTRVVVAQQAVFNRQFPLNLCVYLSDYSGSVLSFLILAVPVFNGTYDNVSSTELSGIISKNTFVSMYLMSCFSNLVDLSNDVSTVAGNTHRIAVLMERMEAIGEEEDLNQDLRRTREKQDDDDAAPLFVLKHVSYGSPYEDHNFVERLDLTLSPGKSVFITGPSNSGKTSLFRVVKGLWPVSVGSATRNPTGSMFLPQAAWFGTGSLRSQLYYPFDPPDTTPEQEGEIWSLFGVAGLDHLPKRAGGLDTVLQPSWYESLSPGERQRLSFLRVLCRKPKLVFLDEATSALDPSAQVDLYTMCQKLHITTVTIGHHSCLEPLHDSILQLKGVRGEWELKHRNTDEDKIGNIDDDEQMSE